MIVTKPAIIFDLSEVYLRGLLGTHELISDEIGKDVSMDALNIPEQELLFSGKISEEDFWLSVLKRNSWSLSVGRLKSLVRYNFREILGTRDILEALSSRGYNLALLSVHAKEWVDYLEDKFDYHKLFNTISYSYYPGATAKPDPLSYKNILLEMCVTSDNAIFIDDRDINVISARDAGIYAIKFQSPEQLILDLEIRGVLI
ncbi:MAG: HAD hydrolase-like protein [Chitinophagales bacterium]